VLAAREGSLRRIATLVAGGAASPEVFAAIASEVAQVLEVALVVIWRVEPDRPASVLGAWSDRPHPFQVGTTWPVDEPTATRLLPQLDRPMSPTKR
jgi:GAF domain-containing protein